MPCRYSGAYPAGCIRRRDLAITHKLGARQLPCWQRREIGALWLT